MVSNPGFPPIHSDNFTILFSNINSIQADDGLRFELLVNFSKENNCKVIALCEVGDITDKLDNFTITNYNIIHYTKNNRGLILYAHDSVLCELDTKLMGTSDEFIWAKSTTLGIYYRSPSQSPAARKDFMANFYITTEKAYQQLGQTHNSLLILGDFNASNKSWYHSGITNTAGRELKLNIDNLSLTQCVSVPTRLTRNTHSCLDLLITDSPGFIHHDVKAPIGNSDHATILAHLDPTSSTKEINNKIIWQYHLCDYDLLNNEICNTNWNSIINITDTNSMVGHFTIKLQDILKRHIPFRQFKSKTNDKPWFSNLIKKEIIKRDQAYKKFTRTKNIYYYLSYKNLNATIHNLVRDAKSNYNDKLINDLDSSTKQHKNYWSLIKKFLGQKFSPDIPILIDPETNKPCSTNLNKANLFLKTLSKKYHQEYPDTSNNLPPMLQRCNVTMTTHFTDSAEILKLIKNLKLDKACGPDWINNKMLHIIGPSIAPVLAKIFNKLILAMHFQMYGKLVSFAPSIRRKIITIQITIDLFHF